MSRPPLLASLYSLSPTPTRPLLFSPFNPPRASRVPTSSSRPRPRLLCWFDQSGLPGHGEGSPREEGEVRAAPARGVATAAGGGDPSPGVPNEPAKGGQCHPGMFMCRHRLKTRMYPVFGRGSRRVVRDLPFVVEGADRFPCVEVSRGDQPCFSC